MWQYRITIKKKYGLGPGTKCSLIGAFGASLDNDNYNNNVIIIYRERTK